MKTDGGSKRLRSVSGQVAEQRAGLVAHSDYMPCTYLEDPALEQEEDSLQPAAVESDTAVAWEEHRLQGRHQVRKPCTPSRFWGVTLVAAAAAAAVAVAGLAAGPEESPPRLAPENL